MTTSDVTVELKGVSKRFQVSGGPRMLRDFVTRRPAGRQSRVMWALRGVSFTLEKGRSLGIIGRNGAGKSTLLTLLCGIAQPDEGSLFVGGHVSPILQVGAGLHLDLTGQENLYLNAAIMGLGRREVRESFDRIIEFSELGEFIYQPLRTYSQGMIMRLGFAVAIHTRPELLLIDEVLAVGDQGFQEKCLAAIRQLRKEGASLIVVSHAMEAVRQFCDQVIWLDHGKIVRTGTPAEVIPVYVEELHAQASAATPVAVSPSHNTV